MAYKQLVHLPWQTALQAWGALSAAADEPSISHQRKALQRCEAFFIYYFSVMFFVYILYSKKAGRKYIGQTEDLVLRLEQHNSDYFIVYKK
jgi:hypothetical protein